MAKYPVVVPRLGEAVIEATLTRWLKNEGEPVAAEEPIAEIATDKVDSGIVSPVAGTLVKKIAKEGDIVPVGQQIAELETDSEVAAAAPEPAKPEPKQAPEPAAAPASITVIPEDDEGGQASDTRFYSPLVRSIARQENIPFNELGTIRGTGKGDRVTKQDVLDFIEAKRTGAVPPSTAAPAAAAPVAPVTTAAPVAKVFTPMAG